MLSLDQMVFFLVLAFTIDFIILLHLLTFLNDKNSEVIDIASFMAPFTLFLANFIGFSGPFQVQVALT